VSCSDPRGAAATAALLDEIPGVVFTAGDLAYIEWYWSIFPTTGFARCYDGTWGRHKARTRPAPGNHEYEYFPFPGRAYFTYFGVNAGERGKGYYSYDLETWHVVVLNSNCAESGGCGPGSPQEQWLRHDLQTHGRSCIAAYWHHPLFSSGPHGGSQEVKPFWDALHQAGATVVVNGHDHDYERFGLLDSEGRADPERGIREFVVGTGGAEHYEFRRTTVSGSEVRNNDTFGVLKLTLHEASYEWQFVPEAGRSFTDHGAGRCH